MKCLLLAVVLLVCCCNPFGSDKVVVYVESDEYNTSFETGRATVETHFKAFERFCIDGVVVMDKLAGLSIKKVGKEAVFHFVGYKPDTTYQHDFTLDYKCNNLIYGKLVEPFGDTALVNNLKVWYK